MVTTKREFGTVTETKIPTYHGRVTGVQKSITFNYFCAKCKFTEDFETPPKTWICKCEAVN